MAGITAGVWRFSGVQGCRGGSSASNIGPLNLIGDSGETKVSDNYLAASVEHAGWLRAVVALDGIDAMSRAPFPWYQPMR